MELVSGDEVLNSPEMSDLTRICIVWPSRYGSESIKNVSETSFSKKSLLLIYEKGTKSIIETHQILIIYTNCGFNSIGRVADPDPHWISFIELLDPNPRPSKNRY